MRVSASLVVSPPPIPILSLFLPLPLSLSLSLLRAAFLYRLCFAAVPAGGSSQEG